ncbi:precorrin-6A reductase [uncultured Oscillibacter sp.]|jgi:precorrin-6x reductase|uniref:precorrin-6A reductase n=1 Tax=uncultured Oscillibacter sp. TaxID=876091 RepID=UPI0026013D88|nr:precorrin-6A reductase [uncultured Oscillibacter sp.]
MKLLIFGGTTEGRVLAGQAAALGAEVTVSVATPLGAEELAGLPGVHILAGRLDQAAMETLLAGFDACVDATHPYAKIVTAAVRAACENTNTPLRRLLRAGSAAGDAVQVPSCTEAAAFLAEQTGNILLATGSKELAAFSPLPPERLFARVLPTHDSIAACEALGLPHRNILALQGPFTQKLNEAMLEQYRIAWLVTKDGGSPGGFDEKLSAARNTGVRVVLVERPADGGENMDAVLFWIKEGLSCG